MVVQWDNRYFSIERSTVRVSYELRTFITVKEKIVVTCMTEIHNPWETYKVQKQNLLFSKSFVTTFVLGFTAFCSVFTVTNNIYLHTFLDNVQYIFINNNPRVGVFQNTITYRRGNPVINL